MRLLFITPEYPPEYGGGIGTYYGALLPALARRGHEVVALVGSAFVQGGARYERDGVQVRFLERERFERALPGFERYASMPELRRHLAAAHALWKQAEGGTGFDAVEVTDWGLLFAPWVANDGPATIVQLHGSSGQITTHEPDPSRVVEAELLRLIEVGALSRAQMVATLAHSNVAEWEARLGRGVHYVPPPLAAKSSEAREKRRGLGFAAGRLQAWKGPHVLAEALTRLGNVAPVVEWAGRAVPHPETGEPFDKYLARRFPEVWGKTLHPLGLLRPGEVAQRQASAAFVVVPSVWDVFNLTVAEAMQQGAVVVCSDGAGAFDLIEDGESGFVVPAGDAAALAEALSRAANLSEAERDKLGQAARRIVAERLNPDRVAAERESLFERAVEESSAKVVDEWIRQAISPGSSSASLQFLDHLPLRSLAGYVARRGWQAAQRAWQRS